MKNQLAATIAIAAALLTPAPGMKGRAAHAVTTILQPHSFTIRPNVQPTDPNELDTIEDSNSGPRINLTNQNGLSSPYESGVTNFRTYTTTATHGLLSGYWLGLGRPSTINPVWITFDLNAIYNIEGLALWNIFLTNTFARNSGINQFEVFSDNDDNFRNGDLTSLGTFSAHSEPIEEEVRLVGAQTFSFTPTETQYVNL